jgi:hypothetical protein|tara:strand:+ start:160 stop:531 length:372 start_codon:yes stop_codon:yes gene_type:complete
MWYLSGNRDESIFEDPEKLIVHRLNARAQVVFEFGVHLCIGNRLAEMQLRVLWEEIMKRFHTVEVVGDVERLPNNFFRGINKAWCGFILSQGVRSLTDPEKTNGIYGHRRSGCLGSGMQIYSR